MIIILIQSSFEYFPSVLAVRVTVEGKNLGLTKRHSVVTLTSLVAKAYRIQAEEAMLEAALGEQEAQLRQAVSEAIANTLTAEQRQIWQRYLSDRAAQANRGEIPTRRDRASEARQWEALKQALRDANVPLTPEQ